MAFRNIRAANAAPYRSRYGLPGGSQVDSAWSNGYVQTARNSANTGDIPIIGSNADGYAIVAGDVVVPARALAIYSEDLNASLTDCVFWIAPVACTVAGITEVHNTVGSDGSAVTIQVRKCKSGIAVVDGDALLSTAFDAKATTRVVQTGTLVSDPSVLAVAAGDRLAIDFTGTLTALTGVNVVVALDYAGTVGQTATCVMDVAADAVDQCFFIANRDMVVTDIDYAHEVAGSDASAVAVQVVKDTSTNAPGAGTDMLSTAFDCKGTANVVQNGALATTAGLMNLAAGNRLSVDFSGTVTALAGAVVTVRMKPLPGHVSVTANNKLIAAAVDNTFFISDRDYRIVDARAVWSTASGATTNIQLTKDISNNAPGGGTDLLTMDTNAGFQNDGTANTVEVAAFQTVQATQLLTTGDRLALDYAGTQTATEGVVVSVLLERI